MTKQMMTSLFRTTTNKNKNIEKHFCLKRWYRGDCSEKQTMTKQMMTSLVRTKATTKKSRFATSRKSKKQKTKRDPRKGKSEHIEKLLGESGNTKTSKQQNQRKPIQHH